MSLRVGEILAAIDGRAPFASAAEWDAVGLQIGDPEREVSAVAVVHELTTRLLDGIISVGAELVVTYHPLLFRPLSSVTAVPGAEGRIFFLIERRVAVISAHTNWDAAPGGSSDSLAAALEIRDPEGFAPSMTGGGDEISYGRCGSFGGPLGDLADLVQLRLGVRPRLSGPLDRVVRRVAVLPGSGGSRVEDAVSAGADAYVTGDVSHHEARRAADSGMAMVDAGHTPTERPGVRALYDLVAGLVDRPVEMVGGDDNPWEL
ncbi:MAG: Nif3-like dinuclear metal center hexameric protein [bacterium]|nr:Nif3-like dinuclear metal center hexameric protein [bacterium]MDE0351086.1 Nif3-like dinuclear metal center hexameric protein [bacterium]